MKIYIYYRKSFPTILYQFTFFDPIEIFIFTILKPNYRFVKFYFPFKFKSILQNNQNIFLTNRLSLTLDDSITGSLSLTRFNLKGQPYRQLNNENWISSTVTDHFSFEKGGGD